MVVQPFSRLLGLLLLVSGITLAGCTTNAVNAPSSKSTDTSPDTVVPPDSASTLTSSEKTAPSPEVSSVSPEVEPEDTTTKEEDVPSPDASVDDSSKNNSSDTDVDSQTSPLIAEDHLDAFLYQYYDLINQRQYEQAWARLGNDMKANNSYDSYVEWWNSVQRVDVEAISQIYASEEGGEALVQVSYDKSNGASSSEVLIISLGHNPSPASESSSNTQETSDTPKAIDTSDKTDAAHTGTSLDTATRDTANNWFIQKVNTAVSVAPTRTETPTTLTPAADLVLNGIGPIRVGMSLQEAANAAGLHLATQGVYGPGADCDYYQALGAPHGVSFMVSGDRIVRVDVDTPDITTPSGAGIGSSIEEIKALYPGKIEESGHKYIPDGKYLRFVPTDSADQQYRILFETDETGNVTRFRSGFTDEVGYVEGCS